MRELAEEESARVGVGLARDEARLMTVADLSAMLQVKPSTIYAWSSAGFCPVVKLGGALRFRRSDVVRWIDSRATKGRARRRLEIGIEDPNKRKNKDKKTKTGVPQVRHKPRLREEADPHG